MSTSNAAASATAGTAQLNKLSVVAIVMAAVSFIGLWFLGIGVIAVFAVGAGHVSLNQIKDRHQRGRRLSLAALAIGYAMATWALIGALMYIPLLNQ